MSPTTEQRAGRRSHERSPGESSLTSSHRAADLSPTTERRVWPCSEEENTGEIAPTHPDGQTDEVGGRTGRTPRDDRSWGKYSEASRYRIQRGHSEMRGKSRKPSDSGPPATVAVQRQASAGARDGVKGKRNDLAARAPLHALVRRPENLTREQGSLP